MTSKLNEKRLSTICKKLGDIKMAYLISKMWVSIINGKPNGINIK